MSPPPTCNYTNEKGTLCRSYAVSGSEKCIAHNNPERKAVASKRMRKTKQDKKRTFFSVEDVLNEEKWTLHSITQLMRFLMQQLHQGLIDEKRIHAFTALANIATRTIEKGDLETRLEILEQRLAQQEGNTC